jgi:serine/threonine-protein kinase
VLAIMAPLCGALDAAHAHDLVHRDVKASNVILGHDAIGTRPVLLDFGLVKLLDLPGPSLTSSRSMLGTPAAMAPEQMKGQPVDARTDVYALGLLAYHMLTGAPAYGGTPGLVQTYLQHHGPRPRPSAHVDIDPAIDEPIARALQPDPEARFASAGEFLAALRAVIDPAPATGEQDVLAVYLEAGPAELAAAASIATTHGMTVALTAPDSLLAVGPVAAVDSAAIAARLTELAATGACVAFGRSRASICGGVVDGPALDVEGWAPYPLARGLWIAPALR